MADITARESGEVVSDLRDSIVAALVLHSERWNDELDKAAILYSKLGTQGYLIHLAEQRADALLTIIEAEVQAREAAAYELRKQVRAMKTKAKVAVCASSDCKQSATTVVHVCNLGEVYFSLDLDVCDLHAGKSPNGFYFSVKKDQS